MKGGDRLPSSEGKKMKQYNVEIAEVFEIAYVQHVHVEAPDEDTAEAKALEKAQNTLAYAHEENRGMLEREIEVEEV
tara:strand:+ start:450 stop:680 length:231 start_codon:yes stop_codon:yes gene_type:complete